VVISLERGADLHIAQLMPVPLTVSCVSKIRIGLPFWYRLTWIVLDKGPLNGCVCVCVSSIRCTVLHTTVCGLLVVVVAAVICSIGGGIDVDSMVHIKMSVTV